MTSASTDPLPAHVRAALDALPVIAFTSDGDGRLDYVNERWTQLTGVPTAEAAASWSTVVHPEDHAAIAATFDPHASDPWELEYRIRGADGVFRWYLGRSVAILDEGGRVVRRFGTAIDVDARKRVELQAAEAAAERDLAARRALMLHDFSVALMAASTSDAAAHVVAERVPAILDAASAILWLVDGNGDLVLAAHTAVPEGFAAQWRHIARSAETPAAVALRGRESLWVGSEDAYRRLDPSIAEQAVRAGRPLAFAAVPLVVEGRELGVAAFGFRHPHDFAPDERTLIATLCSHLAQALERARLIDAQQRALEALRVVARVGEMLSATLDVRASLHALAEAVVPAIADWCAIDLLVDGTLERLTVQHADRTKIALAHEYARRWPAHPGDGGSYDRVLVSGEPLWARTITPEMIAASISDPDRRAMLAELDVRSSVQVPLRDGERVCGVASFIFAESGREFDEAGRDLAVEVGRRASAALTNASLYASEQRARDRVTRLQRVTAALASAPSSAEVGAVACVEGAAAVGAASAALFSFEDDRLRLVARQDAAGRDLGLAAIGLAEGEHLVELLKRRRPTFVRSTDEAGRELLARGATTSADGVCSLLCAPLVGAAGAHHGLLAFGFTSEDEPADEALTFARTLVEQCALALERALVLDLERRARERLAILAAAGDTFSATSDPERTLEAVVRVTLPALADFGFFDVVEDGGVRRVSGAHDDPEVAALLGESRWVRSERTDINLCALSSGASGFHPFIDDAFLQDMAAGEAHLEALRALRLCSMVTVPVVAGGDVIGALTLCYGRSGRHHTQGDLHLVEELARRGGVAVAQARLYGAAQEAARRAEEANRVKDEFLATVSHELRTPLNAILGWAQLLHGERRPDPAQTARGIEVIFRNARAQSKIIDDILDVSRIISGKLRIQSEELDLTLVARDAIEVVRPAADAKGVRLELDADGPVPMVGDTSRLQQVAWNLLSNAVKFTPPDGVVRLVVARGDGSAILRVTDSGQGIAPEMLSRVFERFIQADSSSTRAHGGLGLGLAIVRDLVALHGGTVVATSDGPGCGATFTVELPLRSQR